LNPVAEDEAGRGPILDIRVRWRAGRVALALAGLLAFVALARPLSPGARPGLRLAVTLALGLGIASTALLASLRGRGRAEQLAFYVFLALALDGLGQMAAPLGWPVWPLMALLVAGLAVAETLWVALAAAALAFLLDLADAAPSFALWKKALAEGAGYTALALAVDHAVKGEKRRLSDSLAELARLKHGIDQLEDEQPTAPRLTTLRQISDGSRRARKADRAAELDQALGRLVGVARAALSAHAVLYFDADRDHERAFLRAADGPPELVRDSIVPLRADPFAFVMDRRQAFYATDFKRLLWSLPYYKGEVKVGTLMVAPVFIGDVVQGFLVADRLDIQSFTGAEPQILERFAALAADTILRTRAVEVQEEAGQESRAVYRLSQSLASLTDAAAVRGFLFQAARNLVPVEGGGVVIVDDAQSRYVVESAYGWAAELEGREVGLSEKTWAAWTVRSAEGAFLLDDVAAQKERMPFLVLDEGTGRGESLLVAPLRTRNRTLGGLLLTGARGSFSGAAQRVIGVLANQAAASLATIGEKDRAVERAERDGLTGLYNRRAFDELLGQAVAREERQQGRFSLVMFDIDHFKRLNDDYGHPAGDAALRRAAFTIGRHLRKGDQAARYGGEEFVAILPGADERGAVQLAERVRAALHKDRFAFEGAWIAFTASFGVAVWPGDGKDPAPLVAAADRALYAAKKNGRNRVITASSLTAD
jgi:diguanylate cyclase (GGDEF)-like protein